MSDQNAQPARKTLPYGIFGVLKRLWAGIGSPFPGAARHLRHAILGKRWPVQPGDGSDPPGISAPDRPAYEVAVVITSHNYGSTLADAIESVLTQSFVPHEILVVDDASTDDTAIVAQRYAHRGVGYLRGEWRHVSLARNAGAAHTVAPFLLFLDADDRLAPDYVLQCVLKMQEGRHVGIVYGDMQMFNESAVRHTMPEFDRERFERRSYLSSHALIRRQAFDLAGGYRVMEAPFEDWDLYRRILQQSFTAVRAPTQVYYNVHSDGRYLRYWNNDRNYADMANLRKQPLTIFTPFAGRMSVFDEYLSALRNLECDPAFIRIHWYNTSTDPAFDALLRSEIARLPFAETRYTLAPLPELWDVSPKSLIRNRMSSMQAGYFYELAVVRAYNTLRTDCTTEFALVLEDDIAPEPLALEKMLAALDETTVAVVAPYRCQLQDYWLVWNRNEDGGIEHVTAQRTGIEEVGGSGFGCSLFRMSALRKTPLYTRVTEDDPDWYDRIAFTHLKQQGKILCDWDISVRHLRTERYKNAPVGDLHSDAGVVL